MSRVQIVTVLRFVLLALVIYLRVGAQPPAAEPPLVVIPPVILHTISVHGDTAEKPTGAALAELVQLALQSESDTAWRFVERDALDVIIREQQRSLSGSTGASSAIRTGRLGSADWVLTLRLRADDLQRPRVEAEVADVLRADLLARVETVLDEIPNESWLLQPNERTAALVRDTATRALTDARAKLDGLAGHTIVAPLAFINSSGTDRLAPLGTSLHAALRADHPGVRVLGYESTEPATAEARLHLAGMTDMDTADWSRFADVFVWGEFSEDEHFIGPISDLPITLRLWIWRDAGEPRELEFSGTFARRDTLVRDAAVRALAECVGGKVVSNTDLRLAAARRLLEAGRAHEPLFDPEGYTESRRGQTERLTARLRLIEVAAFFAPEDLRVHEDRAEIGLLIAEDSGAEQYWTTRFWSVFDQTLVGDGRPEDIALIARAARYDVMGPGLATRFIRIGEAWRNAAGPIPEARLLSIRFIHAAAKGKHPDFPKAVETLWPVLRHLLPELLAASGRTDPTRTKFALSQIYKNNPDRCRALLADELITNPTPPAWLANTPTPPADSFAPEPNSAFESWKKTTPFTTVSTLPPDITKPLETPWLAFSPWNLVREPITGTHTKIASVYLDQTRLWVALREPPRRIPTGRHHPRNNHFRIDLASADLARTSELLAIDATPADVRRHVSETWISTRGAGLRVLGLSGGLVASIDSAAGLARDHVPFLALGRGAVFLGQHGPRTDLVARVDTITKAVSQVPAPFAQDLPGVPAAVRAAIASFGDETPPKVRLPAEPLIIRDDALSPDPSATTASPARNEVTLSHQPAGTDDGYWIADRSTVLWAAGARRVPLIHWPEARIFALADDGRHLFVLVADTGQLPRPGEPCEIPVYGRAKIHVYDHCDGAWRGWFSAPAIGRMSAAPGLLCVASDHLSPVAIINTAGLGTVSADAPPPAPSAPEPNPELGWTPLHTALWADDARTVATLIEQGASLDGADARGWSPVQIAAAWASPACLDALLRRRLPAEPLTARAKEYSYSKYNFAPSRQHPPLRAAALAGRVEHLRRLLDAGADPAAAGIGEQSLLQIAIRHAPAEAVGLLLRATNTPPEPDTLRKLVHTLRRADLGSLPGIASPASEEAPPLALKPLDRLTRALLASDQPDLAEIRAALDAGADPCAATDDSFPPLLEAAYGKHLDAIETMLPFATATGLAKPAPMYRPGEHRAGPQIPMPSLGTILLHVALDAKRPDLARRLLAAGVVPLPGSWESMMKPPLLSLAIASGDTELVTLLRKAGFATQANAPFTSPLHEAISQKNAPLLAALLAPISSATEREKTARFRVTDHSGRTALHAAVAAGWVEGVKMLLDAGAPVDTAYLSEEPTILDAVMPWPEIAILLNQRPGDPSNQLSGARAVAAVHKGDNTALAALSIDADVLRYRDFIGCNILHHAISQGRLEFVARLVEAGADIDALTPHGETPLAIAAHRGRHAILDYLLSAGARPDLVRGGGNSPLLLAARNGDAASVRSLLTAKADPDLRSGPHHATALLLAAESSEETKTVKLLIAAGASLHATNSEGFGVLEYAVGSDSSEKIQYLVDKGAIWRNLADEKYHPMNYAAENGLVGSIRKLQQLGLQSPRALSLAKDDATRAVLQGDDSEMGRRIRDDEEQWPALVADPTDWRERIEAHVKSGGNPNHLSFQWGNPLMLALRQNSPEKARFLIGLGADPARLVTRPGYTLNAKSPLYFWFEPLDRSPRAQDDARSVNLDVIALEFLDLFWVHEPSAENRATLLRVADKAGLTQAAAWMRARPTP